MFESLDGGIEIHDLVIWYLRVVYLSFVSSKTKFTLFEINLNFLVVLGIITFYMTLIWYL